MGLFGAIQGSANALQISQLGIQVVGNNISNVNTPGYIRQDLVVATAPGYRDGDLVIGQGVVAVGVKQKIDNLVVDRLRQTQSQLSYQEQIASTNSQIESLLNELGSNDLSSSFSRFANAFQDVANQPGDDSARSIAIQRGTELATQFRGLSSSLGAFAARENEEIVNSADQINRLTASVASFNRQIVETEGGALSQSDAVGLRDQRLQALDELSQYVDVNAVEQRDGSVTVFVGGEYLVANGIQRSVKAAKSSEESGGGFEIRLSDTDSPLVLTGGKVKGLYDSIKVSRSSGFQGKLDGIAKDLIRVVNRIHSQGQGTKGFSDVSGESQILNAFVPLESSNAAFDIENGSFTINVSDPKTGLTTTHEIFVKQQGLPTDTTAKQLATAIDAIGGISAKITNDGRLQITSDSKGIQFSFANDTSGALASLGINTLFRGNSASNIELRPTIVADPSQLAVSRKGIGQGGDNAIKIAEAFSKPSDLLGGRSINSLYTTLVSETTRDTNTQKGVADGLKTFQQALEAQHLGVSGVNLDEEAIKLVLYQRAFQATAKVVTTASELLQVLVNI